MAENGNGEGVRYSVKELLLGIRADIAGLSAKIDQKADKAMVTALEQRIAHLEDPDRTTTYGRQLLTQFQDMVRDVAALKITAVSEKTVEEYKASQRSQRNWMIGLALSNGLAIIAIVARWFAERQ